MKTRMISAAWLATLYALAITLILTAGCSHVVHPGNPATPKLADAINRAQVDGIDAHKAVRSAIPLVTAPQPSAYLQTADAKLTDQAQDITQALEHLAQVRTIDEQKDDQIGRDQAKLRSWDGAILGGRGRRWAWAIGLGIAAYEALSVYLGGGPVGKVLLGGAKLAGSSVAALVQLLKR